MTRPSITKRSSMTEPHPRIGFVSLGCPKALVDSERILTQLRAEGYEIAPSYEDAELVVVNTCGFIEAAIDESLCAIDEALAENGRVIVTGCLGARAAHIRERFPEVLAITGPQRYEELVGAVHRFLPPHHDPFLDLLPPQGVRLTPRHYAYLKISEGCNHRCSFCIIPALRGRLQSRPIGEVFHEAERLVAAGVQELLVISQDTSAYGVDLRHRTDEWHGRTWRSQVYDLARGLGELGVWVRLHYVYPYPHVDDLIPLMAEGSVLPYLDIPFQHGSPRILKRMRRPAAAEDTLRRIEAWRAVCPEIALRSTFIVGFPGETETDFEVLLDFLSAAQLDRVGCFQYSPVDGAKANDLPDPVPPDVKEARYHRLMQTQLPISRERLRARIGQRMEVLLDEVANGQATARSFADAPEIDGKVHIRYADGLRAGDRCRVLVEEAGDYDVWGRLLDTPALCPTG
jgi:ribosomal protein S12 methylthiotransferase